MDSLSNWREAVHSMKDEDEMEKKILIGLSTGEHIRRADFLPSFIGLSRPPNSYTMTVHGQSPAKSRNMIVEKAIENECTHIFFLDDDMIPPPDTLLKLLAHNKDVVSALYLLRAFPHRPALFDKAYDNGRCKFMNMTGDKSGLVQAVNCGLGAVLIATEVFKVLKQPWVRLGEIIEDEWCDDVGFFNRVRKAGFKIWCDLDAPVGHMTNLTIWPDKVNGQWFTNYKHQNGNVHVTQQILSQEEIEKQEAENAKLSVSK